MDEQAVYIAVPIKVHWESHDQAEGDAGSVTRLVTAAVNRHRNTEVPENAVEGGYACLVMLAAMLADLPTDAQDVLHEVGAEYTRQVREWVMPIAPSPGALEAARLAYLAAYERNEGGSALDAALTAAYAAEAVRVTP